MTISIGVYRKLSKNKNKDKTGKQPNVKKIQVSAWASAEFFPGGQRRHFAYPFQVFIFYFI